MNTKARITSILEAGCLDSSVTGLPTFDLAELALGSVMEMELPGNLRLGHLAERIVAECIKSSSNYVMLHENVQLIEDKKTIGEIDFILQEKMTEQIIHLELAYKFYLFDPAISSEARDNWIGPNRNDSLKEKLVKLKQRQFPLLYHSCSRAKLAPLVPEEITQAVCFLVSLFLPYGYEGELPPVYEHAVKGHYMDLQTFLALDHSGKSYHLPTKTDWGIEASANEVWTDLAGIEEVLNTSILEKRALLCWQKHESEYSAFFVVWW